MTLIQNKAQQAVFLGEAADIPAQNAKLKDLYFLANDERPDAAAFTALETKLGHRFPELFLDFISQCGGFNAGHDFSYPCALNDMRKSLRLIFDVAAVRELGKVTFTLFDGMYLPATRSGNSEMNTLRDCFSRGDYDNALEGRDWEKQVPFASDNSDLLCLDFNAPAEPSVVYLSYDGVEILPAPFPASVSC
ncbi:SMI1/KNR4 family protein [Saccharospirillum sp. MSK14-1]|uniref:SMI1/KNR4 family protein n=1 Tax=Saccharospirillum sp. MSK14-1 TaxID=1897632 RepID=UPI001304EEF2|nr:SMI1/KNR4 family protein [Saccharospirillum sp. MSK14-1]